MGLYNVRVPMCGYVDIEVEAETESDANSIGMKAAWSLSVNVDDQHMDNDSAELIDYTCDFMAETGRGNVTYLECDSVEVDKID